MTTTHPTLSSEARSKRNKAPLTVAGIRALKPKPSGPYRVSDYPAKGLNVTVLTTGNKKWTFAYTHPITKKRTFWNFAEVSAVSLANAHKRVDGYRQQVSDGTDPRDNKKRIDVAASREAMMGTVGDLFDLYIKDLKKDNKTSWVDVQSKYDNHIKKHIGDLRAADVDLDAAAEMLSSIGHDASPGVEKKCRTFCKTAWTLGIGLKGNTRWRKSGLEFGLTHNPFDLIEPPKNTDNPDTRFLNKNELIYVWNNLGVTAMHKQLALALKLLLATGQRTQEVLFSEWKEFDLEDNLWTIPWQKRKTRNKVKNDNLVPLNDFHITLLKEIKKYSGKSKYLFSNASGKDHRSASALSQGVNRFHTPTGESKREAMEPFAAKTCRKTFKTLGAQYAKISKGDLDKLQGHSDQDVSSKHYLHYEYLDEKRAAMLIWTRWLDRTVNKKGAKVIRIA